MPEMALAMTRELSNPGHGNWKPSEFPEWALLELEFDFLIWPIQVEVALKMLNPEEGKNFVMQLNMGQGKTSVIIPMLAATLANRKQLVRVVVLNQLMKMNYDSLVFKLGGLLNRKVCRFPCHRQMPLDAAKSQKILKLYTDCMKQQSIVMASPEHLLSFQLKVTEMALQEKFNDTRKLRKVQEWMLANVRDLFDECDEILNFKYQLIYTIGQQLQVGGGALRWKVHQIVIKLIKEHAQELQSEFGEDMVEYVPDKQHIFPHIRLLSQEPYTKLCENILDDVLSGKTELPLKQLPECNLAIVRKFILQEEVDEEDLLRIFEQIPKGQDLDTVYVLRGLLACGVLQLALRKRWRVNYGVNSSWERLMAVPFKAKDIAAERTEFGHPDVAITLAILSYYKSGLSMQQLKESFVLLLKEADPEAVYQTWLRQFSNGSVEPSISCLRGINMSDDNNFSSVIFPLFCQNMAVIDYWLDNFVFPRETKQFPHKLIASPSDLCPSSGLPTTGFSGTNDKRILYPQSICQRDLPELQGTNAEVVMHMLKSENNRYRGLPANVTGKEIIRMLTQTTDVRVLLDAGALITELTNEQVAREWLKILPQKKFSGAIFFDQQDRRIVLERNGRKQNFEGSPYEYNLKSCVIYMDDAHTRGTDFKIPKETRACLTLGQGMTKDKFVQAAMRMRMLGQGHTLTYWVSHEVHQLMRVQNPCSMDVLRWVYWNTVEVARKGKVTSACQDLGSLNKQMVNMCLGDLGSHCDDEILSQMALICLDPELIQLEEFYGKSCTTLVAPEIIKSYRKVLLKRWDGYPDAAKFTLQLRILGQCVIEDCTRYIPDLKLFSTQFEEEQVRELEKEIEEERQVERPGAATPRVPQLHQGVKTFACKGTIDRGLGGISPAYYAFRKSTFWGAIQPRGWSRQLYATDEFCKVIDGGDTDDYLRAVTWVAVGNKGEVVLFSPFEVNELVPILRNQSVGASIHMYATRQHAQQNTLIYIKELAIGPCRQSPPINQNLLVQIMVLSGGLYFKDSQEQKAYCSFLGLCTQPRTAEQQEAFNNFVITLQGFVKQENRQQSCFKEFSGCQFDECPVSLVSKIIQCRGYGNRQVGSHVASILDKCVSVEKFD